MATCEACGNECPAEAAYCGACGHLLGSEPREPVVLDVCVGTSMWDRFWSCLSTLAAVLALLFLVSWVFSC